MKALIVHGGAGSFKADSDSSLHRSGIEHAVEQGFAALEDGKTAIDAAELAVMSMEKDPVFNCGYGSVLDYHGKVEMDAAVMTSTLEAGGVVNLTGVEHPIHVARLVMERTDHVLLGEPGLGEFLEECDVPHDRNMVAPNRAAEWKQLREEFDRNEFKGFRKNCAFHHPSDEKPPYHSTVGAVALDEKGLLVAATSTGGIRMKMFGRIGDTALFGCGTYANSAGAASATGIGEQIVRITLCRMVVLYMETLPAQQAVDRAMAEAHRRGYECGVIAVDRNGNVGYGFTTEAMSCGYVDAAGARRVL